MRTIQTSLFMIFVFITAFSTTSCNKTAEGDNGSNVQAVIITKPEMKKFSRSFERSEESRVG